MLNTTMFKSELPVLMPVKNQLCISVIMPFNPKMITKTQLNIALKNAVKQVQEETNKKYGGIMSDELLDKLQHAIQNLDYTTHKKSIAIYISETVEKVYYLNIAVHEKVIVDSSFEIRDVVHNKKDDHEFLLLSLSGKQEKIYVGNIEQLRQTICNNIMRVQRNLPEAVANFTNRADIKETRLKKFLRYIDNGLPLIFKAYPLPLFVLGTEKTLGYFKQITKHQAQIAGYIHGNFDNATEPELKKVLQQHLKNWNAIKESYLINRLKLANDHLKLTTGIHDVWLRANRRYRQLLVVEKNFYCPAFVTENGETIFCNSNNDENIVAKDAVDDIIEKVLQNGGDVEFVDDLKDYDRIALIETNDSKIFENN